MEEKTKVIDRRNDVNGKYGNMIVSSVIALFVFVAWATAGMGYQKASDNGERITHLEASFEHNNSLLVLIREDIKEFQDMFKRSLP